MSHCKKVREERAQWRRHVRSVIAKLRKQDAADLLNGIVFPAAGEPGSYAWRFMHRSEG